MPPTVNVNHLSVAHASSVGLGTAFPDVCKTPSPAGPVPIPYPNIAMSADTDGTAQVKCDGASCLVKGANVRMSSGDEAGVALGVVSNKIKGKAEFAMYSFDVKFEGKNVCRLTDPVQQNMGSANAMAPAWMQAMFPGIGTVPVTRIDACRRAKKQEEERNKDGAGASTAWRKSGIHGSHQGPIQTVVNDLKLKVFFRPTKLECTAGARDWIGAKYQPKPHSVLDGTTIRKGGRLPSSETKRWLDAHQEKRGKASDKATFDRQHGTSYHTFATASPSAIEGGAFADGFIGLVGATAKDPTISDPDVGKPLLANLRKGIVAPYEYTGKYITGDYDIMDVLLDEHPDCKRLAQSAASYNQFAYLANKRMDWDGIQHGPQAQFSPKKGHDGAGMTFSTPFRLKGWLRSAKKKPDAVKLTKGRALELVDENLIVVSPRGASSMDDEYQSKALWICCGCRKPTTDLKKEKDENPKLEAAAGTAFPGEPDT